MQGARLNEANDVKKGGTTGHFVLQVLLESQFTTLASFYEDPYVDRQWTEHKKRKKKALDH